MSERVDGTESKSSFQSELPEFLDFSYFVLTETQKHPFVQAVAPANNPNVLEDAADRKNTANANVRVPDHYVKIATLNHRHTTDLRYFVQHCASNIMCQLAGLITTIIMDHKPSIAFSDSGVESIYSEPGVFTAVMNVLRMAYYDYRLFGVVVFAFPRDLLKWATDKRAWRAKTDSKGRATGDPSGESWFRVPHSQRSPLVPFTVVPVEHGDVDLYFDNTTAKEVPYFVPQTEYARSLSKNFRFAAMVDPNHRFTSAGVTTGLSELYNIWIQRELCMVLIQSTDSIAARPTYITQVNLADKSTDQMTESEMQHSSIVLPDAETMQPTELVALLATKKVSVMQAMKIWDMLSTAESSSPITMFSSTNLNPQESLQNTAHYAFGGRATTAPSVAQLAPRDIELLRHKAFNIPLQPGQLRDQYTMPIPIGTELRTVVPAVKPYQTYQILDKRYAQMLAELFDITESSLLGVTRMVTGAESTMHMRRYHTAATTSRTTLQEIFDWLYVECGMSAEIANLTNTIAVLRERLAKINALGILRDYLLKTAPLKELTPDKLVQMLTDGPLGTDLQPNEKEFIAATVSELAADNTAYQISKSLSGIYRTLIVLEAVLYAPQQLGVQLQFEDAGLDEVPEQTNTEAVPVLASAPPRVKKPKTNV